MGKTSGNSAKICCIAPIGKALTIHLGVRRRIVARLAEFPALLPRSFQLPRVIILIESYDELSAAADRGVGELRLMTLGNQGSS